MLRNWTDVNQVSKSLGPTNYRKTPNRKTPQDTHKTPQDTARHLQDTARDLKKDACKVIIDIQGYGGGGFVFSQFVQKCNKNVLPIETHCTAVEREV